MELQLDEQVMCGVQGRLFQLSAKHGYDSEDFIKKFMNSETAAFIDLPYDRHQWAGEEYLLEELEDTYKFLKISEDKLFDSEVLFWIGYLYRYWHYYKSVSSKEIYAIADASILNTCWLGYHTLDIEFAIDRLIEAYHQNKT